MTNSNKIKFYDMDIDNIGETSVFEFAYGLCIRDDLERIYDELSDSDKQMLRTYDKKLLSKAQEAYDELKTISNFNSDKPLNHWWNHFEKIVHGDLIVTIDDSSTSVHLKQQKT